MKELWKDIVGYEGCYQVSDLGNIKSLYREVACVSRGGKNFIKGTPEKILKLKQSGNTDYWYVNLCKDGVVRYFSVHRLVAQAFVSNPENKAEVNHIDGNKKNNLAINLEWATRSENLKHRYRVLGQTNRKTA